MKAPHPLLHPHSAAAVVLTLIRCVTSLRVLPWLVSWCDEAPAPTCTCPSWRATSRTLHPAYVSRVDLAAQLPFLTSALASALSAPAERREARLWNDVFVCAQEELGLPQG